jgi:hypothetical protein
MTRQTLVMPCLREEHMERSQDFHHNSILDFRALCLIVLEHETVLLGSLFQDDRLVCLLHGKCEEERSERDENHAPLTPLPVLVLGGKSANNRTISVSIN